ncbi:MAG: DUF222 domain-containing protein [Labedaea sp.]
MPVLQCANGSRGKRSRTGVCIRTRFGQASAWPFWDNRCVTFPAIDSFGAIPGAEHAAGFIQAITDLRRAYPAALSHLAEMGHARTAHHAGYSSSAAFVAELVHINRQKAARMLTQAEHITSTVTPTGHTTPATLPTLRTALLDGLIDGEHIDAVADAIKELPTWATLQHRELLESTLAETARTHSPAVVRDHGRVLLNRINQDGTDPHPHDHEAEPRNTFRYTLLPTGRIKYTGEGDPETAEELVALFGPLAKPTAAAEGVPDPRPVEQRQGDAFAAVVHLAVTAGDAPVHGGIKPHLNVILDHTTLVKGVGNATLDCGSALNAHAVRKLACDAEPHPHRPQHRRGTIGCRSRTPAGQHPMDHPRNTWYPLFQATEMGGPPTETHTQRAPALTGA